MEALKSNRVALLLGGTRVYSRSLAIRMGAKLRTFQVNPEIPPETVIVIHGAQSGADEVADGWARLHGYTVIPIPYFSEMGDLGGGRRDVCMVRMLVVLRDFGAYEAHAWMFPDDQSVGTRKTITELRGRGIEPNVEELGPRRDGPLG